MTAPAHKAARVPAPRALQAEAQAPRLRGQSRPPSLRPQLRREALCVLVVGGDDPLYELVAHDVLLAEADELDPLDLLEHVGDHDQPRVLLAREVDLCDVSGDDHPGTESEPGEEHL